MIRQLHQSFGPQIWLIVVNLQYKPTQGVA